MFGKCPGALRVVGLCFLSYKMAAVTEVCLTDTGSFLKGFLSPELQGLNFLELRLARSQAPVSGSHGPCPAPAGLCLLPSPHTGLL